MLISDAGRIGVERFVSMLPSLWGAGLRLLQIREPEMSSRELDLLIARIHDTAPEEAVLVVNGSIDLAHAHKLHGVHLRGNQLELIETARARLGDSYLVGFSAHGDDAKTAGARGADYVTFAPVFEPLSKTRAAPPRGIDSLQKVCEGVPIPVYALGGLNARRTRRVRLLSAAAGVATIGAVLDAPDPARAVGELLAAWIGDDAM